MVFRERLRDWRDIELEVRSIRTGREWLRALIPWIILIGIIPVIVVINNIYWTIDAVAYHLGSSFFLYSWVVYVLSPIFVAIIIAPALIFNYMLFKRPREESLKLPLIAVIILENTFLQYLILSILFPAPTQYAPLLAAEIYAAIMVGILVSPWALLFLVIMPFLQREISKIDDTLVETQKPNIRNRLIGIIMPLSIFLVPVVASWRISPSVEGQFRYLLAAGLLLLEGRQSGFAFSTLVGLYYPLNVVTTVLYILYVYNIIEYLNGRESRLRCIIMGLLATIIAPVMPAIFPYNFWSPGIFLPVPITLVIGFIVLFRYQPIKKDDHIMREKQVEL